jgi:hypothetical protein
MDDITGFLLIGIAAVGTILIIAALRDKGNSGPLYIKPTEGYTPLFEEEGPSLPSGTNDILDPSRMDYLSPSDRNIVSTFWSRTEQYNPIIHEAAKRFGIPSNYIRAVMYTESSGINWKDLDFSIGLMQVSLGAAKDGIGYTGDKSGLLDPRTNILAGAGYLCWQLNRFNNDLDMATASYNFGSVHRWAPGVAPIAGVDGDAAWDAIVSLVKEGKIKRYTSYHLNKELLVNTRYVDKVNKWWGIFNNVIIPV